MNAESAYLALLLKAHDEGTPIHNARTGKVCRTLIGEQLKFDLRDGFPALTTKKLPFKSVLGELLGFFRGYDNAEDFRALGCNVWNQNANETPAWLANPFRRGPDDLGRIYGVQWTKWMSYKKVRASDTTMRAYLAGKGYQYEESVDHGHSFLYHREVNQLEDVLRRMLSDPSDRRLIISAWNVAELDEMALAPCHMDYRFVVDPDSRLLHVVMTQRSADMFLGVPFNMASTALLLTVMARFAGYIPATVTMQFTNAHVYEDHTDAVLEQVSRQPTALPILGVAGSAPAYVTPAEIPGVFASLRPEQFALHEYNPQPAIHAPMAV